MNKIWITSDWHFNHNKSFIYESRGFNSVYEMNETIIQRYNSVVDINDEVYCLGDCMLGNNEDGIKLIKQLKGKIHIILGNHCTNTRAELYETCYNIVDISYAGLLKYNGYNFYLSHYPTLTSNYDYEKPLKRRVISLCGHSHVKDPFADADKGLIFHCELDTNDCRPWLLNDIIDKIKSKLDK